jgi:two-component system, sensor histidine kinase LadS
MFAMVLYNLFIFLSLRRRIYLTYVLYMLFFIVYFLLFNGHAAVMADLGSRANQILEWVFLGGSIFFSISFCQQFFDTRINTPIWHRIIVFFQFVAVAIVLLGILERHEAAAVTANAAGALGPVNLIIIAAIRWRQGFETAKYYILANLSFMLGTWVYVFWTLGLLPIDVHSNLFFTLGPAVEALLLSFALADRIRGLENEKMNLTRTQAVYKKASETDGLTGLYNKAYLIERLETEVREATKSGRPLAFIILDVDDFKTYNDTYGHPEGDLVLRSLAGVITTEIRERDAGCRYGGEEFAVIFPDIAGDQALNAAERIRQGFAGLSFHPGDGPAVSRTVSIGLAQLCPEEGADDLIRRADQALYQAKRGGKNRVVAAPAPRPLSEGL